MNTIRKLQDKDRKHKSHINHASTSGTFEEMFTCTHTHTRTWQVHNVHVAICIMSTCKYNVQVAICIMSRA